MNCEETVIISGRGKPSKSLLIFGILFSCIIFGIIYLKYYFDYKKSWIMVTNMRIKGITVNKEMVDLPLNTVISAVISDNGWGCFLTVFINSNNNKPQKVVFPQVENNILICNAINQLVAAGTGYVQSQMPQQPEVQQPVQPQMQQPMQPETQQPMQQTTQSVTDELKKFKELLDCGVITQQEFDDKKRQLLAKL